MTIDADFVGFTCPDVFVVGYGMDAAHAFRQLPSWAWSITAARIPTCFDP